MESISIEDNNIFIEVIDNIDYNDIWNYFNNDYILDDHYFALSSISLRKFPSPTKKNLLFG